MAMDADFMTHVMKIPYFKSLVDANGQDWFVNLFDSLHIHSYNFSQFETLVPSSVSLLMDDTIELDVTNTKGEATEEHKEATNSFDQWAPEKAPLGLGEELGRAQEEHGSAGELHNSGPSKFDNDPQKGNALYYVPPDDRFMDRRPSFFYSARDADEAVTVSLAGGQEMLKLSAFGDRIYTAYVGTSSKITVSGGDGSDTLYLTQGDLTADLSGVSDFGKFGGNVTLKSVENVIGSDGNDTIIGDGAANKLVGRGGDDTIGGGAGDDTIIGGGGNNKLTGGAGKDTIHGGSDDDVIDGGSGDDVIEAGGGDNEVSGGNGDDKITTGAGDDRISGGLGADNIISGAGNDNIDGGGGNDSISGGGGDDVINGGGGNDTLNGDAGKDTIGGGAGDDTISGGDGNDVIKGGDGDDTINGDAGKDTIDGGAGDDTIHGGDGDDVITGGDGNDSISGGAGTDTITGGAGADTITGGDGADVYVYIAATDSGVATDSFDIITDFDAANDKFDLTALLGGDEFFFLAAEGAAFTGADKEVRWDKDGGRTIIEIDLDGDGTADMKIELDDEVDLTASNFNL